jgi:hypothetical protein
MTQAQREDAIYGLVCFCGIPWTHTEHVLIALSDQHGPNVDEWPWSSIEREAARVGVRAVEGGNAA